MVKFAGVLVDDSGKPPAGIVGVTFSLYRGQQGGAPLWMETQNVQPDKARHYLVMLWFSQPPGSAGPASAGRTLRVRRSIPTVRIVRREKLLRRAFSSGQRHDHS